ncbi:MAG: hypothetical protein KGH75_00195 [Rhodospirillales bacterium]|nr:hypothetical protein [Rhodospirillales bacterium]
MPATPPSTDEEYVRSTTNVERREPTDVHEAIRCVMLDLGGIPKMTTDKHRQRSGVTTDPGERGVRYAYRSIDQITGDAQRSFGLYGCIWKPKVLSSSEREFTMGNNDTRWTDTTLEVVYYLVGPGGAQTVVPVTKHFQEDGSYVESPDERGWYMTGDVTMVGPLRAIGRDNADKGLNKAMTQAFKQALLQVLSIGDPQDEGDHSRAEVSMSGPRVVTDEMAAEFKGKVKRLPKKHAAALVEELKAENIPVPELMSTEQYGKANALLQLHVIQAHREAGAEGAADDALGLTAGSVEPPVSEDELAEAKAFLGEMIELVPETDGEGRTLRLNLQSHLRGLYGTSEAMTYDQVLEATAIASHWPDPVPAEVEPSTEATLPPPQPAAEASPSPSGTPTVVTPQQQVREQVGDEPTDALIDDCIAEVTGMTAADRKDALRERGLKVSGFASDVGFRLAVALVKERSAG